MKKLLLTLAAVCGLTTAVSTVNGQTTLMFEDFEDADVEYTTSIAEFSDGQGDYFIRTDGSDMTSSFANFSNIQGSSYFAAQDIDGEGASSAQTLTFSIGIEGYTDLTFSGLFAEDEANDEAFDWDSTDYVHIDYTIDGGDTYNLIWFEDGGATNTEPSLDTDFDGVGDSTALTDAFNSFSGTIVGSGTTLFLTVSFDLNSGDEDIALDNIAVTGYAASAVPEPSTYALIFGGLAVVGFAYRRRKQAK